MLRLNNRLILATITFILLLIPLTSYLMLQRARFEHMAASELPISTIPQTTLPKTPTISALQEIQSSIGAIPSPSPGFIMQGEPAVLSAEATPSGLRLRVKMDDRPINHQQTKLFVGIAAGETTPNPKYVLSFLIDLDQNGQYSGISLTGLSPNSIYTAYLKGISQLATSREFTFQPGLIDLGLIPLISGDVNNDNIVDSSDFQLVKENIGKTSTNFDLAQDVNNDGVINSLDLAIINQNLGKRGEPGVFIPSLLNQASQSAQLQTSLDLGGPEASSSSQSGYWLWIPKVD